MPVGEVPSEGRKPKLEFAPSSCSTLEPICGVQALVANCSFEFLQVPARLGLDYHPALQSGPGNRNGPLSVRVVLALALMHLS